MKAKQLMKLPNWNGDARVFELNPPMEYESYDYKTDEYIGHEASLVIVSAVDVMFSGAETYIFAARKRDGVYEDANWAELTGSSRGTLDHTEVLNLIGYEVE